MGGNSSSEQAARENELAALRRKNAKLEAEKQRLQQVALEQHWTEKRLQEEQRQKEAAEKWRREQQHKAAYAGLQRQVEELKIQQQSQTQQQQKLQQQQASAPLPTTSWESISTRETVAVQQRVSPNFQAEQKPSNPLQQQTKPIETPQPVSSWSSINLPNSTSSQASLVGNAVVLTPQKVLPQAKSSKTPQPVSTLSSINPQQATNSQASVQTNEVVPKQLKGLPQVKAKSKNAPETCVERMNASNVRYAEWSIIDYVTEKNSTSKSIAVNIMNLLDNENTVSFIARYRKGMTQGMEADEVRNIKNSYERAKLIKQRAISIIKEVDKQRNWTPEFHAFVHETKSLSELDHIYSIFKVSKATLVQKARDAGLGNIAKATIAGEKIVSLFVLVQPATEGLRNEEQVKEGLVYIIADAINKDKRVFDSIKKFRSKYAIQIETKIADADPNVPITMNQESNKQKYAWYNNFTSAENALVPVDISNIRRGEAEKVLSVNINIPPQFDRAFKDRCLHLYAVAVNESPLHKELITAAIDYMYDRWTKPFIRKLAREKMNEKAEIATMEIVAQNVKRLLLAPPVKGKVVIGIVSISQWICKLAAVSERGDFLEAETIYPHNTDNPGALHDAEMKLVRMVRKYKCTNLAVGNGTASREHADFLTHLIRKKAFGPLEVSYTIVEDAGLQAGSFLFSSEAFSEFSNFDDNVIAAVSIARRLQDPMAEFVKIPPIYLVEKMNRQDVTQKQLDTKLNEVIVEAVSSVGVDVNTASVSLLKRVAGLDEGKAKSIIEWRKSSGPFTNRNDLLRVSGIGNKTFEQCAGFIRIMPETAVGKDGQRAPQDSFNYLDQTLIHPKSYDVAKAFLEAAKCNVNQLGSSPFIFAVKLFADQGHATLAKKFGTGKEVMELIVKGLTMERAPIVKAETDLNVNTITTPARNPKSKMSFDDLTIDTVLTGVISEIKHFGAFASVGVGRQGLIQKRHMNGITLTVGQRVETIVNKIDKERRVFSLKLIKCI